jgi:DNA segregation ATPase FtsK/SpoIIIE, S-DNA-T family
VLDNTDASEKIPKYEQGLFLDNMGTLFRAFYFRESDIK